MKTIDLFLQGNMRTVKRVTVIDEHGNIIDHNQSIKQINAKYGFCRNAIYEAVRTGEYKYTKGKKVELI